jgi:hypothetical protein
MWTGRICDQERSGHLKSISPLSLRFLALIRSSPGNRAVNCEQDTTGGGFRDQTKQQDPCVVLVFGWNFQNLDCALICTVQIFQCFGANTPRNGLYTAKLCCLSCSSDVTLQTTMLITYVTSGTQLLYCYKEHDSLDQSVNV